MESIGMKYLAAVLAMVIIALPVSAAEDEPVLPPVAVDSDDLRRRVVPNQPADDELEPQVVIRKAGKNTVEEYRINGRLFKVRVTPAVGPSYFMVDTDGDGVMDRRFDKAGQPPVTPQWVLFKW